MKKSAILFLSFILYATITKSQDFCYTTVDAGSEYQWNPDGFTAGLQFAFNAKVAARRKEDFLSLFEKWLKRK